MDEWVRWSRNRNELGFIEHTLVDTVQQVKIGYVKPLGKVYEANVTGRPVFTRDTLKSAKSDVEYMYNRLGVGRDAET